MHHRNRPTPRSAPIPYPDPDHLILPLLLSCGLWGFIGWAVWVLVRAIGG